MGWRLYFGYVHAHVYVHVHVSHLKPVVIPVTYWVR
jgi:hypothetical protein